MIFTPLYLNLDQLLSETPPTDSQLRTDKELFFEALDLRDVRDRTAFLDRVCTGDPPNSVTVAFNWFTELNIVAPSGKAPR